MAMTEVFMSSNKQYADEFRIEAVKQVIERDDIDAAIVGVLHSGWYILGPEVEAFEAEFALYCDAQHAVGVANGLDALQQAYAGLGFAADAFPLASNLADEVLSLPMGPHLDVGQVTAVVAAVRAVVVT